MTKETLLEDIKVLTESSIGFELFFVLKNRDIKKVHLDTTLYQNMQTEFTKKVLDTFNVDVDFTLKSVADLSDEKLESEYFYFDSDTMYDNLRFIIEFASQTDTNLFQLGENKYKDIDAILIKIGTQSNNVILYKHHYPINVLSKKSTINIFKEGDTFKEVIDDVFKIDINFDFLVVDEHIVINKLKTLETKFDYTEVIYAKAFENIEIITALDFVENLDMLKESIKTNKWAKKLNKVQGSPVIEIIRSNQEKVINFIKSHPKLKQINFTGNDKLKLDTKISVERFLKLLDDDYLHSQLTEMLYDTNSKDSVL